MIKYTHSSQVTWSIDMILVVSCLTRVSISILEVSCHWSIVKFQDLLGWQAHTLDARHTTTTRGSFDAGLTACIFRCSYHHLHHVSCGNIFQFFMLTHTSLLKTCAFFLWVQLFNSIVKFLHIQISGLTQAKKSHDPRRIVGLFS